MAGQSKLLGTSPNGAKITKLVFVGTGVLFMQANT